MKPRIGDKAQDGEQSQGIDADRHADMLKEGIKHHESGRFSDAEQLYQQILAENPRHAHALHMRSMIAFDLKKYEAAEEFARKALAEKNDFPLFFVTLGNTLKAQGKVGDAIASYKHGLTLKTDMFDCLNNLGSALISAGKMEEAIQYCKQAHQLNPSHANPIYNIGVAYYENNQFEQALPYFEKAILLNPHNAQIFLNKGRTLYRLKRRKEAAAPLELATRIDPNHADAFSVLGLIAYEEGRHEDALKYYSKLKSIQPDAYSYANLALVYQEMARREEAIINYKKALELQPNTFEFLNNLGIINFDIGKYEEAAEYLKQALALKPNNELVISNLATAYKNFGQIDQAVDYFKKALKLTPDNYQLLGNLLLCMVYAASVTPEELADTAITYSKIIADPLRRARPLLTDKNPARRLRIGYVSADFRNHAVNFFFEPLLKLHDRKDFEVFGYSNTLHEDKITERLKKEFDHWRDVRFINDDEMADLIEKDQIDILIDIAGHTGRNRLLVFARKPAPVQATWLGYPATTGLQAIHYKITDHYAEPAGLTEHLNTETLWRLPDIFCCYNPSDKSPAVIDHPPFEDNGYVIFGCFNNFTKVTDDVLKTWSKIIAQVPNSRLMLEIIGVDGKNFRTEVEKRITNAGIPIDHLILEQRKPENQFALYNRIDMALDPYPCNGGTTSMDTLWMGVPFVTLEGKHFVSRMGVTILTNAGLPELIAKNEDEYIKIAIDLANDRERLKKMRNGLRERVKASPVMDQQTFVRNMEDAYRGMWQKYCSDTE